LIAAVLRGSTDRTKQTPWLKTVATFPAIKRLRHESPPSETSLLTENARLIEKGVKNVIDDILIELIAILPYPSE